MQVVAQVESAGLLRLAPHNGLVALLKDVGGTLEEEHAEDVLLVLGGVHLAAQDVGRFEEVALELGQGEFGPEVFSIPFQTL